MKLMCLVLLIIQALAGAQNLTDERDGQQYTCTTIGDHDWM